MSEQSVLSKSVMESLQCCETWKDAADGLVTTQNDFPEVSVRVYDRSDAGFPDKPSIFLERFPVALCRSPI